MTEQSHQSLPEARSATLERTPEHPSPRDSKKEVVCVLGLGYVGLPTAAVLASRGHMVRGVDTAPEVAATINSGKIHIVEPDLDLLVQAAVQTFRLKVHGEPGEADVFLICVPTPLGEGGVPDLSYVESATRSIAPHVQPGNLVVLESTSPPGTTERIAEILAEEGAPVEELAIAHAPERVLPGQVLKEVVSNDRVVGGLDPLATQRCHAFYATFTTGAVHPTTARMAETAKLVENAFRDVGLAFANELSMLCEELELDVWELISLANRHPRVNILNPGSGVGGHCIAVDPLFLAHKAPGATRLIQTARSINDRKPDWLIERVKERAERLKSPRIACLGLAYKPDIDDLRESPARYVAERLLREIEGDVRIAEPNLDRHPGFELQSVEEAIRDADIVVILVAHKEFRALTPNQLSEKIVFDPAGALRVSTS